MKLINFTAAALLAASSLTAHAGLLTIDGGSNTTIPNNNDFRGFVGTTQYNFGGNLTANQAGSLNLTFNFLAEEADAINTFTSEGTSINNTNLKTSFSYTGNYAEGDLINFGFTTSRLSSLLNYVFNGANVVGDGVVSFAIALDTTYKGVAYDAILFFDDAGGVNDDDNHDDLLIGVKAAQVPESSAFILMALGIAGLVTVRRRKMS